MIDTRVKFSYKVLVLPTKSDLYSTSINFLEVEKQARRTASEVAKKYGFDTKNLILFNVDENGKSYKNSIKRNGKWKKQLD